MSDSSQGKKFDQGKPSISNIPAEFILGVANVFNFGAQKYGRHNYRQGLAHSRCLDAAARHLLAIMNGEDIDPESGLPHVYHLGCSVAMYDWNRVHHPELDDRYKEPIAPNDPLSIGYPSPPPPPSNNYWNRIPGCLCSLCSPAPVIKIDNK
jgi:hypothetical protein